MPLSANIKRNGCSLDFHQTHMFLWDTGVYVLSVDEMIKMVLFENTVEWIPTFYD